MIKNAYRSFFFALFLVCCFGPAVAAAGDSHGKHTLIYAADFGFSPYRIRIGEEYGGFEVDVTRAIFKDSQYAIIYQERDWKINQIPSQLRDRSWDIIGWRIIDPIVSAEYIFSDPVFEYHWGAFTLPGVGKLDIAELGKYKVGIVGYKFPAAMLRQRGYVENRDFTVYDGQERAMRALMSGEIDIWLDERLAASSVLIKANALSETVYHEELEIVKSVGYAIRPLAEHAELKEFIDRRIREIKSDGQFESLYRLYFGSNSAEYLRKQQKNTVLVLAGMVMGLLVLAIFSAVLISLLRKHSRLSRELRQTVAKLDTSREQYQMAVEGADDGIIYYDNATGVLFLSPRFFTILDLDASIEHGLNSLLLAITAAAVPEDRDGLLSLQEAITKRQPIAFSTEMRIKYGEGVRWVLLRLKSHVENGRFVLGGTVSDITTRKEHESVIVFYADCDPLTGIYNRRKMDRLGKDLVSVCQEQRKTLSVVFMDLDNFKRINDTLGHQKGDLVLTCFVNETKRLLPKDAVFGRVGGDEFLILLPHRYRAVAIMQGILFSLNTLETSPAPISASIGVAFYPQHGRDLEELIRSADAASGLAKARGKNRIEVFDGGGVEHACAWSSAPLNAAPPAPAATRAQAENEDESGPDSPEAHPGETRT